MVIPSKAEEGCIFMRFFNTKTTEENLWQ
jgi:hypothetical protein